MRKETTMKLSEAIRLGSMMKPQAFGDYFRWESDTEDGTPPIASCALGAALDAIGEGHGPGSNGWHLDAIVRTTWPVLWQPTDCSALGCGHACGVIDACSVDGDGVVAIRRSVAKQIVHLNDYHKWTRDQIADWVATIEPAEQPDAEPAAACDVLTVA